MRLDGLFLDMYGTIAGGDRAAVEAVCARLVADADLPLGAGELSIVWGERFFAALNEANGARFETLFELEARTLCATLTALNRTVDPGPYIAQLGDYWRAPPLQPEAREFFARFPHPIWIVSNADEADLHAALAHHGLRVAGVITSEAARSYKPDSAIFELALQRSGWSRTRVLHVGDSLHSDVGGGRAAGLRTGWLNRAQRIHDIGTAIPDHEFSDLTDLLRFVAGDRRAAAPPPV